MDAISDGTALCLSPAFYSSGTGGYIHLAIALLFTLLFPCRKEYAQAAVAS